MNKKTREQLRACIAKDLIQGQGQHYPTKELLKQYVPLEGIITTPASDVSPVPGSVPVENPSRAAVPREKKETADDDLALVRAAYEKATGNCWNKSDSEAYHQNGVAKVPIAKTLSELEAVTRRRPTRINSFKYFVREIVSPPDPRNRAWQKKRLKKIVTKVSDISVGRAGYSMSDFVEDVKRNCAREDVMFDNDLFNELVG